VRFASCEAAGRRFAALVEDGRAVPLRGVEELGAATPSELLAAPPLDEAGALPLDRVRLRPLVPSPRRIVCVGHNYGSHVAEVGREVPSYPVLFTKFHDALIGPYDPIVAPPESRKVDYEAELAVVVGRAGRRIDPAAALAHVAGYAVANDVTMRDFQFRTHQWLQGKSWSGSTPLGPWLVTPEEVGDPGRLEISLERNGERLQQGDTSAMIFDVPTLLARISEFTELEAGDVILTGTPAGVGHKREPQVFLEPDDRVAVEISGVGRIENEVVAEAVAGG